MVEWCSSCASTSHLLQTSTKQLNLSYVISRFQILGPRFQTLGPHELKPKLMSMAFHLLPLQPSRPFRSLPHPPSLPHPSPSSPKPPPEAERSEASAPRHVVPAFRGLPGPSDGGRPMSQRLGRPSGSKTTLESEVKTQVFEPLVGLSGLEEPAVGIEWWVFVVSSYLISHLR